MSAGPKVKVGKTCYAGTPDDLVAQGIIGRYMIPEPGISMLDFHFGTPCDWDYASGEGIQQVFWASKEANTLYVFCWARDRDSTAPVLPCWNCESIGNVVALPTAAPKAVKNRRAPAKPGALRLVWSAPA